MPRIIQLDEDTIAKIAAGEVIERPASVVKELVENSIDAGATIITVSLEEGGKRLISITDNGCGMSPEDTRLAFDKHATSKISSIADLDELASLGFRGEALPSIAEVSRTTLITRENSANVESTAQDIDPVTGTEIRLEGGKVIYLREAGAPVGTTVIVENLFFNLPVRRRHMKSPRAEFARISDVMTRFALGHPEISFSLKHNNRRIFSTPRTRDVKNTITEIIGREIARGLLPIKASTDFASLSGYIAKPVHTRGDRSWLFLFVNGRSVKYPELGDTLRSAYGNLMPKGKFPVGVLYIDINPSYVDVNIHPSKEKILLFRDYELIDMLFDAAKAVLAGANLIPSVSVKGMLKGKRKKSGKQMELDDGTDKGKKDWVKESAAQYGVALPAENAVDNSGSTEISGALQTYLPVTGEREREKGEMLAADEESGEGVSETIESKGRLPSMRPIGQIMDLYILAGGAEGGLYIIDQHAAHEKALFERFLERARDGEEEGAAQRQPLIAPVTFSIPQTRSEDFESVLPSLLSVGFEIEPFGRNSYVVKAIPAPYTSIFDREVMESIAVEMLDGGKITHKEEMREKVSALMACHTAVRAGKSLTMPEIIGLLEEIAKAKNPFACPHGRPTIVHLSTVELEKMFRRR